MKAETDKKFICDGKQGAYPVPLSLSHFLWWMKKAYISSPLFAQPNPSFLWRDEFVIPRF